MQLRKHGSLSQDSSRSKKEDFLMKHCYRFRGRMRYPFFSDCHLSEEVVSTFLIIKDNRQTYLFNTTRGAKMSTTQHRNLQDQKALVTGATSGIGRAMAFQLARDGAEVIVHGRDAARGAETVDASTAAGGQARFVGADLSDPADLQRL